MIQVLFFSLFLAKFFAIIADNVLGQLSLDWSIFQKMSLLKLKNAHIRLGSAQTHQYQIFVYVSEMLGRSRINLPHCGEHGQLQFPYCSFV